jgi:hypothetical protein
LDERSVVEAVLNYGNWDDFQVLFEVMGIEKVAEVFRTTSSLERSNYLPEVKHYFKLFFDKYAFSNTL